MSERSRRLVVKLHDSVDESVRDISRRYLLEGAAAVEYALTRTALVSHKLFTVLIVRWILSSLHPSSAATLEL